MTAPRSGRSSAGAPGASPSRPPQRASAGAPGVLLEGGSQEQTLLRARLPSQEACLAGQPEAGELCARWKGQLDTLPSGRAEGKPVTSPGLPASHREGGWTVLADAWPTTAAQWEQGESGRAGERTSCASDCSSGHAQGPQSGAEPAQVQAALLARVTARVLISCQGSGEGLPTPGAASRPCTKPSPSATAQAVSSGSGVLVSNSCRESWREWGARGQSQRPSGPWGPGGMEAAASSGPRPLWSLAFREGRR